MIARVRATGEIIEAEYNDGWIRMTPPQAWIRLDEIELLGYTEGELKYKIEKACKEVREKIERANKKAENEPNWEQRRYEIAKEMAAAMYLDDGQAEREHSRQGHLQFEYKTDTTIAKEAVQMADALIAELKKGGEL